jgi:hypothetical protein
MKAITLQQPWAALVAAGATNIVTRTWQTEYRGRLAIHAGLLEPSVGAQIGDYQVHHANYPKDAPWQLWASAPHLRHEILTLLTFGTIIATCELVDVAPIGGATDFRTGIIDGDEGDYPGRSVVVVHDDGVVMLDTADQHVIDITSQKVYNDFAPGRFAWILSDVKPVEERCPLCWGEGSWQVCPLCRAKLVSNPVPASGRSGLWDWGFDNNG